MEQIWKSSISADVAEPDYTGQTYTGSDLKTPTSWFKMDFCLFSTVSWEQKSLKYIVKLSHDVACLPSVAGGVLCCPGLSSPKKADQRYHKKGMSL